MANRSLFCSRHLPGAKFTIETLLVRVETLLLQVEILLVRVETLLLQSKHYWKTDLPLVGATNGKSVTILFQALARNEIHQLRNFSLSLLQVETLLVRIETLLLQVETLLVRAETLPKHFYWSSGHPNRHLSRSSGHPVIQNSTSVGHPVIQISYRSSSSGRLTRTPARV